MQRLTALDCRSWKREKRKEASTLSAHFALSLTLSELGVVAHQTRRRRLAAAPRAEPMPMKGIVRPALLAATEKKVPYSPVEHPSF